MADHPTGTVTLVFTDLEGSSELSELHGAAFEAIRNEHFAVLRKAAARWNGFEVETAGDALFVVFEQAGDAVQFAVDAQLSLARHEWPPEVGNIRVRIGMHTGEPFIGADQGRPTYRGPVTNRAARVQAAAHGSQVLLSQAAREAAAYGLAAPLEFIDRGLHRMKGVGEEHLWQAWHPDLRRDFPPLATLDPQRHNLPAPPAALVGRDAEIEAWHALLLHAGTRLLTIIGFGGMGKTRAALQLAELCVQDFPQGVWWVELDEARTGDDMLARIAQALRLYLQPQRSVKEQLWNYLRERKLLLVLDNTEQIADAGVVISELIRAAPALCCLVTSRRALGVREEKLQELPPLPLGDAIKLFSDRARSRQPAFEVNAGNETDVAELCRRLEGVPLALELAASRVISLTPREILAHLAQRFRVLQTRAPDLPPRRRALRAAIDWSHELLSEEDKALFAELGVFARGFTNKACEAVCDPLLDVFEGVEELRRHSLLRAETDAKTQQTRFTMLDSVHEYASEKLTALGDGSVRERHARYFLDVATKGLAQLHTPREAAALQQLETAVDDLRAALEWAGAARQFELAGGLGCAISVLLQLRGMWKQALHCNQKGLEALQQAGMSGSPLVAELYLERAGLHLDQLEPGPAREDAQRAMSLSNSQGDPRGMARASNVLALAAKGEKDFELMNRYFHTALEGFQKEGDAIGAAKVHNNLGVAEIKKIERGAGDSEAASRHLEEALTLRRTHGDSRGSAETLVNLGALATDLGRWDDAAGHYREALTLLTELRSPMGVATALCNLAEVAETQHDYPAARRLSAAAHYLFQDIGSPLQSYSAGVCSRLADCLDPPRDGSSAGVPLQGQALPDIVAWALAAGSG